MNGISAVRIFWQSFVDQATSAPYMARLAAYLNEIAAPGSSVHVEGITPADRDFGRLSEFRCAIQASMPMSWAISRIRGCTSCVRR